MNDYDPCIANKMVNRSQMMVTWHVDDLKARIKRWKVQMENFMCKQTKWISHIGPKFQIPVGILQNSEFCRKSLPIRPETRSDVLFIFIFTRPEPMNLDWSKSELLNNHTNCIQDIKCPVCVNALVSFSVPPPQLNNNGILIVTVCVPFNPQSTSGMRSRHHHSPLMICMEKEATVSFLLFFSYHSQLFSLPHYCLNCYSVDGAARPPSVDEEN
jgi:hypothetical protein